MRKMSSHNFFLAQSEIMLYSFEIVGQALACLRIFYYL